MQKALHTGLILKYGVIVYWSYVYTPKQFIQFFDFNARHIESLTLDQIQIV